MDEKKIELSKALGKVLEVVEEEGWANGWDEAFSLGRSSGSTEAAYDFVDWICTAYDKVIAELFDVENGGGQALDTFDENFNLWLEKVVELMPFEINWVNKVPVFPDDEENKEDDEDKYEEEEQC